MKVFRAIARIKYKNDTFCILINNNLQKYFIKELEDGSIMYPTEEEYKELNYIFNEKQKLAFLKLGKDYKIDPKVILKGGKLVALGSLIVTLSVAIPSVIINRDSAIVYDTEETSEQERKNHLEEILRKGGDDFQSLYGYEDSRMYRIHKIVSAKTGLKIIECQNFEEFSTYIDTKSKPTYEDLRETLRENKNVNKKYKQWLFEGIDNLEKAMPNLDLTVLNYNLNRLNLQLTTLEELNKDSDGEKLAGRFNEETGEAYFIDTDDEESNKFIVYHEVLGHGLSEASFERPVDETINFGGNSELAINVTREKILVSDSIFVMKIVEDEPKDGKGKTEEYAQYSYLGQGCEEGKADKIASIAMGNPKIKGHPYIEQSEQLRIMCDSVGLSFEDYISKGGAEILSQKMQENDVGNSLIYIASVDVYTTAMKNRELEGLDEKDTFKENVLAFFKDYADNKIQNGASREEIVENFSKILLRGGEYIHSTFNGEEINYEEFKEDVDKASKDIERDE